MQCVTHLSFLHSLRIRYFYCVFFYVCYYSTFYLYRFVYRVLFCRREKYVWTPVFFFFLFIYTFFTQLTTFFFLHAIMLATSRTHILLQHFNYSCKLVVQDLFGFVHLAGVYVLPRNLFIHLAALASVFFICMQQTLSFCGQFDNEHFLPAAFSVRYTEAVTNMSSGLSLCINVATSNVFIVVVCLLLSSMYLCSILFFFMCRLYFFFL